MNVAELYGLYQYISRRLVDSNYLVNETGVLNLYDRMLNGEANRKDFLIFAIQDMLESTSASAVTKLPLREMWVIWFSSPSG